MLPTIPYDKSLHWNYGGLIAAAVEVLLVAAFVLVFVFVWKPPLLLLLLIPIVAELVVFVIARLKELRDNRLNAAARDAGQPEPHGVEWQDVWYTCRGGLVVTAPTLFTIAAVLLLVGVL